MLRRLELLITFSVFSVVGALASGNEYSRLARVSYVSGQVSFQHAGDTDWAAATVNLSLQPGDRLYTGRDGRIEVEFDEGSVLRMAETCDIEFLSLRDNLIQLRGLLGLSSLTVRSDVGFEVSTPAASFSVLRKGTYRFDVAENGDSDGIVRKGELDATNGQRSGHAESGEVIHAVTDANADFVLSRYDRRDDWDLWNDRRNAEMTAYESRRYVPDYVNIGVRDLDYYGRWVDVDGYGPGWVPAYVGVGWSPYWDGRWVYRPFWGWTWVSYEPWGWLPYHYGRWHHSVSFGWCWLPGPSYGFHFWSPGLVRFHRGHGWVSWVPLGPGDYYNVNIYHYRSANYLYLNNMRTDQRRAPEDLVNDRVPGALRRVSTDQFVGSRLGGGNSFIVSDPNDRGRVVSDRLDVTPTRNSFAPAPDKAAVRPTTESGRPSIVRSDPSFAVPSGSVRRVAAPATDTGSRLTGRGVPGQSAISSGSESGPPAPNVERRGASPSVGSGASISNRGAWGTRTDTPTSDSGRVYQVPSGSWRGSPAGEPSRRDLGSGSSRIDPAPRTETPQIRGTTPSGTNEGRNRSREVPGAQPTRPSNPSPPASTPRAAPPPSRPEVRSSPPESRPRTDKPDGESYSIRSWSPDSRSTWVPRTYESRPTSGIARPAESFRSYDRGRGRVYSAPSVPSPSFGGDSGLSRSMGSSGLGRSQMGGAAPSVRQAPSGGTPGGGGAGIARRR
jgi:hypothetical protein